MTKAGLSQQLYQEHGALTRSEAAAAIDAVIKIMKQNMVAGKRMLVTNFGSFEVIRRRTRRGRNPITGEVIEIRPRRTLVFRPARKLEDRLAPSLTPRASSKLS